MKDWDSFETVYSIGEAEILKKRMEQSGFEVLIVPRNTSGEMPCWDIYTRQPSKVG